MGTPPGYGDPPTQPHTCRSRCEVRWPRSLSEAQVTGLASRRGGHHLRRSFELYGRCIVHGLRVAFQSSVFNSPGTSIAPSVIDK
eukprot:5942880-Pyramimonas_sp.AAC.1